MKEYNSIIKLSEESAYLDVLYDLENSINYSYKNINIIDVYAKLYDYGYARAYNKIKSFYEDNIKLLNELFNSL
jgi:hypothetical protein